MDKIPFSLFKAIVFSAKSCKAISSAASSLAYSNIRINKGTSNVTVSITSSEGGFTSFIVSTIEDKEKGLVTFSPSSFLNLPNAIPSVPL